MAPTFVTICDPFRKKFEVAFKKVHLPLSDFLSRYRYSVSLQSTNTNVLKLVERERGNPNEEEFSGKFERSLFLFT